MLPADARVRRRVEFAAALRGSRIRTDGLILHYGVLPVPSGERRSGRAGVIVSRAVGGAVVRNRVRRRLRELLRPVVAELPPEAVLVVRALPPAADFSSRRLQAALAKGRARLPRHLPA